MARCTRYIMDKVCQGHATGRWFSPGTPVSSTNITDRHDITEILLTLALNTIKQTKPNAPFKFEVNLKENFTIKHTSVLPAFPSDDWPISSLIFDILLASSLSSSSFHISF